MVISTIRVLVVDGSATVRRAMTSLLSREPDMSVCFASDPLAASDQIKQERPDVIILDLEFPRLGGLVFLRRLMSEDPIPVIVCSGAEGAAHETAIRALNEGAVGIVAQPGAGMPGGLQESALLLADAVRGAAQARLRRRRPRAVRPGPAQPDPRPASVPRGFPARGSTGSLVAIGASTGGPEALRKVLEAMPSDSPGVVIVQHMPELFTSGFASHLNQDCRIEVKEAADGDGVKRGRALIAPGNRHISVVQRGAEYAVEVRDGPLVSRHRPSVDVLFRSVARVAGADAVGVIMTGMGSDGAEGLLEMKEAGAYTVAQSEASCVVFGMPKEAISRGGVREVAPLSRIASIILQRSSS